MELATGKPYKNNRKSPKRKRQPSQREACDDDVVCIPEGRAQSKMEQTPVSVASSTICDRNNVETSSRTTYRYPLFKIKKYQTGIKAVKEGTAQVNFSKKKKKGKKIKAVNGHDGENVGVEVSSSEIHSNNMASEVRVKKSKKAKSNGCDGENVGVEVSSSETHNNNMASEVKVKKTKKAKSKIKKSNVPPTSHCIQGKPENGLQTISKAKSEKVKVSSKGKSKISKGNLNKKGNAWSEKVKLANKEKYEESDVIVDDSGKVGNSCRLPEKIIDNEKSASRQHTKPATHGKQKKVKECEQKMIESLESSRKTVGKKKRRKKKKNRDIDTKDERGDNWNSKNVTGSKGEIKQSHFYSCNNYSKEEIRSKAQDSHFYSCNNYSKEEFRSKAQDSHFYSCNNYSNKIDEMYTDQRAKPKNMKRIPKRRKDMMANTKSTYKGMLPLEEVPLNVNVIESDLNDKDMSNSNRTRLWRDNNNGNNWSDFDSPCQSTGAGIREEENLQRTVQRMKSKAQERREQELLEQRIADSLEETEKEQLISEPLDVIPIEENSFIVVVLPGHSLYLHGIISVRLLVGQAMILGYRMDELEEQNVFSLSSHALLGVQATEGSKLSVSQHSHLLNCGLTEEQLQVMVDKQTEPVTVVELKRTMPPVSQRLCAVGQRNLFSKSFGGENTLKGMLITRDNYHRYPLVKEAPVWREVIDDIRLCFECGDAPCVVVCGGKGVGKSTFLKYVINGLLSVKGTKIQCLDVDPGQSEFSLPSCLSLTQISEPVLGPSYTHYADPSSPGTKQILLGGVSPQFSLQRYVKAIMELNELSKQEPNCPLIINTMGWTVGTGLDLIFDTIRTVKPTHVIQIQGSYLKNNFRVRLDDLVVHNSLGGIRTKPCEDELHYRLIELLSLAGRKGKTVTMNPKLLRELGVMVQLSDILKESTCNTVVVHWPEIVLHICGSKVPRQRILQVLNGNLVALCQVDPHNIELGASFLPKHLVDDLDFGTCLGWGVVRGIDPLTQSLHVLTSFPCEKFSTSVNALIMPELYLPERFYKFFSKESHLPKNVPLKSFQRQELSQGQEKGHTSRSYQEKALPN